jgi:DNA-binding phage protein
MSIYKRIKRTILALEKISFDFDEVLTTSQGLALIKRKLTEGYDVFIITARGEARKNPVYQLAEQLGISRNKVFITGSNANKVLTIKRLGINKHYDNNPDVIKRVKELTTSEAILVNYE